MVEHENLFAFFETFGASQESQKIWSSGVKVSNTSAESIAPALFHDQLAMTPSSSAFFIQQDNTVVKDPPGVQQALHHPDQENLGEEDCRLPKWHY
uniref:Uncharacterized protein n=1 Tax=Romanomermis culicivorax TaxID=13658 RepID=A0A915JPJ4_ROMCU